MTDTTLSVANERADYIFDPFTGEKWAVENGEATVTIEAAARLQARDDVTVEDDVPATVVGRILATQPWQDAVSMVESGDADEHLDDLAALEHRESVLDAIDKRS